MSGKAEIGVPTKSKISWGDQANRQGLGGEVLAYVW
jgi:ribosomal protein S8